MDFWAGALLGVVATIVLRWLFIPNRDEWSQFDLLGPTMMERDRYRQEAQVYEAMYRDLRRTLCVRCSPTGHGHYVLEPLASILNTHDATMRACGYRRYERYC